MKPDPIRLKLASYPYRSELQTEFADVDMLGHLNNTALSRFYESLRARFLIDAVGANPFTAENPMRPMMVDAHFRYLQQGFFPTPIQAGLGVAKLGRTSLTLHQALFQNGVCIGLCDVVMVMVATDGPVALPEELLVRLRAMGMPGAGL